MIPAFVQALNQSLKKDLPGFKAQATMLISRLRTPEFAKGFKLPENHRLAAVMVLVYSKKGIWHTALMERAPSPYPHSRQISFPGGRYEVSDSSLEFTALRETEEEFGINREKMQVLNKLTPLYISASNYLVHPFIAYMESAPSFTPDKSEVAEILEIPLEHLMDENRKKRSNMDMAGGRTLKHVPYFDLANHSVWGATAMILSEFIAVLKSVN